MNEVTTDILVSVSTSLTVESTIILEIRDDAPSVAQKQESVAIISIKFGFMKH